MARDFFTIDTALLYEFQCAKKLLHAHAWLRLQTSHLNIQRQRPVRSDHRGRAVVFFFYYSPERLALALGAAFVRLGQVGGGIWAALRLRRGARRQEAVAAARYGPGRRLQSSVTMRPLLHFPGSGDHSRLQQPPPNARRCAVSADVGCASLLVAPARPPSLSGAQPLVEVEARRNPSATLSLARQGEPRALRCSGRRSGLLLAVLSPLLPRPAPFPAPFSPRSLHQNTPPSDQKLNTGWWGWEAASSARAGVAPARPSTAGRAPSRPRFFLDFFTARRWRASRRRAGWCTPSRRRS